MRGGVMTVYDVLRHFDCSGAEMGRRLGVCRRTIWAWKIRGIPMGRQYELELTTRGKLKAAKR